MEHKTRTEKCLKCRKGSAEKVIHGSDAPMHLVTPGDPLGIAFHPADMTWIPDRECVPVAAVEATSSKAGFGPSHVNDRNLTSRWTPHGPGAHALTFDLGQVRTIAAVSIVWYTPRRGRIPYTIETARTQDAFERVEAGVLEGRGTKTSLKTFIPCDARFVRLTVAPEPGMPLPSIYEAGIHEAGDMRRAVAD